jgi:hypothetical protein
MVAQLDLSNSAEELESALGTNALLFGQTSDGAHWLVEETFPQTDSFPLTVTDSRATSSESEAVRQSPRVCLAAAQGL